MRIHTHTTPHTCVKGNEEVEVVRTVLRVFHSMQHSLHTSGVGVERERERKRETADADAFV